MDGLSVNDVLIKQSYKLNRVAKPCNRKNIYLCLNVDLLIYINLIQNSKFIHNHLHKIMVMK